MLPRKQAAFTLVELLTVIAIVGILAAILIAVIGNVREKARIVSATSDCRSLATAFKLYYSEYGRWPLKNGKLYGSNNENRQDWGKDAEYSEGEVMWGFITDILRGGPGMDSDNEAMNPHRTEFATFPPDRYNDDGWLLDPWEKAFTFKLDVDNDGKIPRYAESHLDAPIDENQEWVSDSVIVWSSGPDGLDWRVEEAEDDPKSW